MKKLRTILLLLSIVFCYAAARQNTIYSCTEQHIGIEQLCSVTTLLSDATQAPNIVIPTITAICINSANSNAPTTHQHTFESVRSTNIRRHFLTFVATIATTTDAVSAHYYIIALRRIIR